MNGFDVDRINTKRYGMFSGGQLHFKSSHIRRLRKIYQCCICDFVVKFYFFATVNANICLTILIVLYPQIKAKTVFTGLRYGKLIRGNMLIRGYGITVRIFISSICVNIIMCFFALLFIVITYCFFKL